MLGRVDPTCADRRIADRYVEVEYVLGMIDATELTLADGSFTLPSQAGAYEIDLHDSRSLKPVSYVYCSSE